MKKLIKIIIIFLQIFLNLTLLTSEECFEYSCEECLDSEYGSCTKCKKDFILIDGTCPCNDYACNICDTAYVGSKCYFCDENYELNEQKQCVCEDPNCVICEKKGCLKCRSGYNNIYSNLCIPNGNNQINCLDENCIQCLNTVEKYTCTKCKNGYELVMGKCEELKKIKKFSCSDSDYYPYWDGYCYPKCGGAKCENYYINNIYKECSNKCLLCRGNDLYLIVDCKPESSIENCSVQKNNNECLVCNVGYYRIRGQCEKCQKGCKSCSDKYTCHYCDHNYNLLNNGTCEEITKFSDEKIQEKFSEFKSEYLNAKENYKLIKNNTNQTNITIEEKCENQHCVVCSKLVNNYCLLCDNNYENINGQCYARNCEINNCAECEEKNVCSYCETGYYLENNSCKMLCNIENCETCSTPYFCDKCKKGYEFNGFECKLKCSISNCLECNNLNKCNKCNNGYYLKSNGYCSKCKTDNCKTCSIYNNVETCHLCDNDFYLENNKCSEICTIKNCEYCLRNENVCAKCKKNCTLKDDKCSCKNIGLIVGLIITFSIVISVAIIIFVLYKKRMKEREERNNVVEIEIDNRINNDNNGINNRNNNNIRIINNNIRNMNNSYDGNNQNNNTLNGLENNYPYIDNEKNTINNNNFSQNNKGRVIEECKICFENKRLKHFKCGCNGKVCNECYEKILKDKKDCPFCRKNIR